MTLHGTLLVLLLAGAAAAVTWTYVDPVVDPNRILGWVVGALVLACGLAWMLNI